MARRCTTVPGFGACCAAYGRGVQSGQTFTFTDSRGHTRCASCTQRPSRSRNPAKQGRMVTDFRFHKGAECGLSPGGCPNVPGGGGGQGGGLLSRF
jgi:hypothetical protein